MQCLSRKEDRECKTLSVLFLSVRVYCFMEGAPFGGTFLGKGSFFKNDLLGILGSNLIGFLCDPACGQDYLVR